VRQPTNPTKLISVAVVVEVNRYPTTPVKSLRFVEGLTIWLVAAETAPRLIVSNVNTMTVVFIVFLTSFDVWVGR